MARGTHRSDARPGRARSAAALLIAGIAFVGCRPPVVEIREPEVADVVAERTFEGSGIIRFALVSGRVIDIDRLHDVNLQAGTPDVGQLLLYGAEPSPWYVALVPSGEGRFPIWSAYREPSGSHIVFDNGLRLPVAAGYQSFGGGPLEPGAPVQYFVNERGEVSAGP